MLGCVLARRARLRGPCCWALHESLGFVNLACEQLCMKLGQSRRDTATNKVMLQRVNTHVVRERLQFG